MIRRLRTMVAPLVLGSVLVLAGAGACSGSGSGGTATPSGSPRPAGVPQGAKQLSEGVTYGSAAGGGSDDERFFSLTCENGLLTVATTRHIVYAELPCDRSLPPANIEPFLGKPVSIRGAIQAPNKLYMDSSAGGFVEFTVGRIWVASP